MKVEVLGSGVAQVSSREPYVRQGECRRVRATWFNFCDVRRWLVSFPGLGISAVIDSVAVCLFI